MAVWDSVEGETAKAYQAFKIYLRMGRTRSLAKVAEELGHSVLGTVQTWSSKFKWSDRILAYENAEMDAVQGNILLLEKENQNQILTDAYVDYNMLITWWREEFDKRKGDLEEIRDVKYMIESRMKIDDMGRRASGLPGVVVNKEGKDKTKLPTGMNMVLPGAVMTASSDEDYDDDSDDEE